MELLQWLIALGGIIGGALWLHSDLKNKIGTKWSLGISFGLMLITYWVTRVIASIIVPESWFSLFDLIPEIVGAGSALFVSVGIARPTSKMLRKRMG